VSLFSSSGYLPDDILSLENGDTLNMAELHPFLRVLLMTDGTVTRSLESYFWESVQVHCNDQTRVIVAEPLEGLNAEIGTELIERKVDLIGERSRVRYVQAVSHIHPQRLPSQLRKDLEAQRLGIGELLRESGLETYRELLSLNRKVGPDTGPCLERSYRIVIQSQAAIHIRENFPLHAFPT